MAEGFSVTKVQANVSFSSGLLLFHVGSNWNLTGNFFFFILSVYGLGLFYQPQKQNGENTVFYFHP